MWYLYLSEPPVCYLDIRKLLDTVKSYAQIRDTVKSYAQIRLQSLAE